MVDITAVAAKRLAVVSTEHFVINQFIEVKFALTVAEGEPKVISTIQESLLGIFAA